VKGECESRQEVDLTGMKEKTKDENLKVKNERTIDVYLRVPSEPHQPSIQLYNQRFSVNESDEKNVKNERMIGNQNRTRE
jgi:hypothetical protein